MIVIAQRNNNESEYQDLPLHNFQTGNQIIAKIMTGMIQLDRTANESVGSKLINLVTYP